MATVAGKRWRRQSAAGKRLEQSMRKLADAQSKTARYFTQRQCNQCDPPEWVRIGDWEIHRANYHRPGGYQFEQRKAREQAMKDAQKAVQQAAKVKPPRAVRPANTTKVTPGKTKEHTVTQPQGGTSGEQWTSPVARPSSNGSGQAGGPGQQSAATSTTEAIAQLFRAWAQQVPPSIPASRADAQAAGEMWRQVADAVRFRARLEAEQNRIPPDCLEPMELAARQASGLGDHHMEQVKRITNRFGEVATVLASPKSPNADYLKGGA